jgi:exopolyphosphatase/guanosine-5'-triphosphate,3'-diphosphate pyrophosphatase
MVQAVIDMGTNTFNLIIADVKPNDFEVLYTDKIAVAIGLGGINKCQLTTDAQFRAFSALKKFKLKCTEHNAENILALGTSAIRDAANCKQFIEKVRQQLGINVSVIDGNTEAELIYNGILWTYPFEKQTVIMDIGGGSTEFVLANEKGIQQKISLNIGISRVFQAVPTNDPINLLDIKNIENWFEKNIGSQLDSYHSDTLIGASGVFETFYEMINNTKFISNRESYLFNYSDLIKALDWLIYSTAKEREEHPFIIPIRKLMGPITAVKIKWILNKLKVNEVWLSPYSMKEGALRMNTNI